MNILATLQSMKKLPKSNNITVHSFDVTHQDRCGLKGHSPVCLWFTGLSGAGKSTIANLVDKKLNHRHIHTYLLDGDNVRYGLSIDLGFSDDDRVENIRRIAELSKLMVDAGLVVITAFISPFISERHRSRSIFPDGQFIEVFIDTPLSVAESRDPKGLYAKARKGEIKNFTGIDSKYEAPANPEIHLKASELSADECADQVINYLLEKAIIKK